MIDHSRITPACAGSTRYLTSLTIWLEDHPRLRGEYSLMYKTTYSLPGSPPLARGVPLSGATPLGYSRITPACAGSTDLFIGKLNASRDHPRLRGEYRFCLMLGLCNPGSPPLARGVRTQHRLLRMGLRITPACAGSTYTLIRQQRKVQDHPRLRGEYIRLSLIIETV